MKIQKKYIRKIDDVIKTLSKGPLIYVAFFPETEDQMKRVRQSGFTDTALRNVKVLPSEITPVSIFNAQGKDIVRKDLPKESYYRYSWLPDWHGYWHSVSIPGKRYVREHIPAPGEEIALVELGGKVAVLSDALPNSDIENGRLLHIINLFLSLFGECEILDQQKTPLIDESKISRVHWNILPQGKLTWEQIKKYAEGIKSRGKAHDKDQKYRYQILEKYQADEIYAGLAGFQGYLVFVFKKLNMSIMENFQYGNATYVFNSDWKDVSKLSKAEILNHHLQKNRLPHNKRWEIAFDSLFQ